MNIFITKISWMAVFIAFTASVHGQSTRPGPSDHKDVSIDSGGGAPVVVIVTGARFSYTLVEHWIDQYQKTKPHVQIVVESRGSADPLKYDILAEVYEHDDLTRNNREYLHVGRYAILPVANRASEFANTYAEKGLNANLIKQIFFHDIFSNGSKHNAVSAPYNVYTRLQKAGVPSVFARYFSYEQKDLKGTSIAGADTHLVDAVLRDSTGVTYLPLPLIYDLNTRKPVEGLTVLPVDINDNKKVEKEEKFYETIDGVIERLEALPPDKIYNIPIAYLHLSIDKNRASAQTIEFLQWIEQHGLNDLHKFGYLSRETKDITLSSQNKR